MQLNDKKNPKTSTPSSLHRQRKLTWAFLKKKKKKTLTFYSIDTDFDASKTGSF